MPTAAVRGNEDLGGDFTIYASHEARVRKLFRSER